MNTTKSPTTLQTVRLWLEPDRDVPLFKRLRWERVDVPLRDVLLQGIHPVSGLEGSRLLSEKLLDAVNADTVRIPELEKFGHSGELNISLFVVHGWNRPAGIDRVLREVGDGLRFVTGDLTYLQLLEAARSELKRCWSHSMVREMAMVAFPMFQDLRRFLKTKDKSLKLSSYEDLDRHNLDRVLSLEDFLEWDGLIVSKAFPVRNFRRDDFLSAVTDNTGRLRLSPEIRHVTLTGTTHKPTLKPLIWHVFREGNSWRFRPDLGDCDVTHRAAVLDFANRWRTGGGKLCFTTSLEKIEEMVDTGAVTPSFPALDQGLSTCGPTARASVEVSRVRTFKLGKHPKANASGERLRDLLRDFGVSVTGSKDALVQKLAALAAERYRDRLPDLDQFFRENRFVRMKGIPENAEELPLLREMGAVGNLVMTMYALKHLRGDAVLDVSHINDTFSEEELALALVTGKTSFQGAFLRVS